MSLIVHPTDSGFPSESGWKPRILRSPLTCLRGRLTFSPADTWANQVPLFGDLLRMVGHFPVYFRSTDEHVFTVDKEKQEEVMKKVQAHVETNGCLSIFPEATLNRTPETLRSFRKGIFLLAEEQQMAVVTLSSVGNNISWPIIDFVGGLPSKITMKISEVTEAGHGMSADEIREKAHEAMQADVTYLFAERRASKPKQT